MPNPNIAEAGKSSRFQKGNTAARDRTTKSAYINYAFARLYSKDVECMKLSSPLGRYYCLEKFTDSKIAENKGLCEKLPNSIYALKWNCYYNYAIRYRDPGFCDKYSATELSGRDRCLNKMSSLLNDKSLCQKISATSDYKQQCMGEK
jgi:hypothetical protein